MKNLEYAKCSPSGNITVLIFSDVERSAQPKVARLIIEKYPDVEQVGFVEKPTHPEASARLQMMGGEFCGNATCALGWVLGKRSSFKHGKLEVSGAGKPVEVSIQGRLVEVEMPVRQDLSSIKKMGDHTLVEMEGISHLIVEGKPPLDAEAEVNGLLQDIKLDDELEAAGVMYTNVVENSVMMIPIVWVRETDTLIREGGCASGSVCVGLWQAVKRKSKKVNLDILQPSGSVIKTTIAIKEGSVARATIAGEVEILEEGILQLD